MWGKTVSCEKQGRGDVVRHCDPTKVDFNHNKNVRVKTASSQIPFVADSSIQDKNVMKAEILHTEFIVQHNISINTAELLNKLYSEMFPDSKIVKNNHCSRTKTTCILNNALAPELKGYLCDFIKNEPYSLVNAGSNDSSVKKMNATCALIFDVNRSKTVDFRFFDMCTTTGEDCSKAQTLFDAIDQALKKQEVTWGNCISLGVANTNTNVGEHNSIKLKENKSIFIAGCNCHLVHLAAGQRGKAYANISGFDMEEHQVDIYYYFKKSTRRKGILKQYVEFVGEEYDAIIRFVQTRWLSLELCCKKESKKYEGLKSMFESRPNDSNKEDTGIESKQ